MKKIYIAGCGGMLGEAFYSHFKDDYQLKCTDIDVNDDWLSFLDFRDFEAYKKDVYEFNPDYLFHLGAYTDLEYCEKNIDDTYLNNTIAVENAVYIANKLEIPLLYISTAGIFDGNKTVYDDWDLPNPISVYGRAKYGGERFVIENSHKYLICRAGWMMGGGPKKDKKFVQKIMQQIKDGKKELNIVDDKNGTPTYTHDFAITVKQLITNDLWGLYNCVCAGESSRLEIVSELLKILKLENQIKIIPVKSNFFAETYFAERPASERLISKKLELRKINLMKDWKISLREYINNYYGNYFSNDNEQI